MPKKTKNYDPYRYQYCNVMYPWGERREYYKEKSTPRMNTLSERSEQIWQQMSQEWNVARSKYTFPKREHNEPATPDELAFNAEYHEIFNKYSPANIANHGEFVAEFLIVNNIAHRGKILHGSTAIDTLKKMFSKTHSIRAYLYQRDIRDCQINDLSFEQKKCEHNLAYFLYRKYGVLLLNQHTYNHILKQISEYRTKETHKKEIQHYQNLLNKFYVADINPKTYK